MSLKLRTILLIGAAAAAATSANAKHVPPWGSGKDAVLTLTKDPTLFVNRTTGAKFERLKILSRDQRLVTIVGILINHGGHLKNGACAFVSRSFVVDNHLDPTGRGIVPWLPKTMREGDELSFDVQHGLCGDNVVDVIIETNHGIPEIAL